MRKENKLQSCQLLKNDIYLNRYQYYQKLHNESIQPLQRYLSVKTEHDQSFNAQCYPTWMMDLNVWKDDQFQQSGRETKEDKRKNKSHEGKFTSITIFQIPFERPESHLKTR